MALATGCLPLCHHRYALFVSYLGSRYKGSQRLIKREDSGIQDTIQEAIEWSLESFLPKQKCRVTACSRTDRGVHALMNCYTLPLMDYQLPTEKIKRLANENLIRKNHDIVVNEVLLVPAEFHPRKKASSREYIYRIAVANSDYRHPTWKKTTWDNQVNLSHLLPVTELYKVLPLPCFDQEKAQEAIDLLKGKHDFASFGFKIQEGEETVREVDISLSPASIHGVDQERNYPFKFYHFHFKSRAFLYNQVRRTVGAIVSYASYRTIDICDIKYLLDNPASRNWKPSMTVAAPWGLFLSKINYDKSSFEGTIKTHEDATEEKVECFPLDECYSGDECEKQTQNLS